MQVSTRTRRHAVNLVCEVLCMHLASDSSTLALRSLSAMSLARASSAP